MKKFLSMAFILAFSSSLYAGGASMGSNQGNNAMSSAKSSSGVHFYGRIYIGYDDKQTGSGSADVENLDDGGSKSRLGLKFTESISSGVQLVGNLEYKFDIGDGTSTNETNCTSTSEATSCRTFDLNVGNLGFKTPFGYIGAGTYEAPYKTMGQFDNNIDTAIALNAHGGTSQGNGGIDGNVESMLAYSATMGPATLSYMYAVSDSRAANDNSNTDQGDYSLGIQFKNMLVHGLSFGYSRSHDQSVSGGSGTSNDRFYASMKVMPNMGVFVSHEDLGIAGSYNSSTVGDIRTIGTHYKMGMTDWQLVYAKGDADGAATNDYKTLGISAQMNLSKTTDLTFGYIKQDFDSTGSDITTRGIGLTHKF